MKRRKTLQVVVAVMLIQLAGVVVAQETLLDSKKHVQK